MAKLSTILAVFLLLSITKVYAVPVYNLSNVAVSAEPNDFKVGDLYYSILSEEERTVAVENGDKILRPFQPGMPEWKADMNRVAADDDVEYGTAYEGYTGNYCSGDIVVPSTIEYEGKTYTVKALANGAFSYCVAIESITLPETITYVGPGAFYACINLRELIFPESVRKIEYNAMSNCYQLSKVLWPSSVTNIPRYAFAMYYRPDDIPMLKVENLDNVTIIEYGAFGSTKISTYPFWDNLKEIGGVAFATSEIEYAKIPEGCNVGEYAFNHCLKLTTVDLPADCPDYVSELFNECENIRLIRIAAQVPPVLNEDWASLVAEGCVLEVPAGAEELYRSAPYWKNFAAIQTNGVEAAEAAAFDVIGLQGALKVSGGVCAKVYDLQGTLLHEGTNFTISLPSALYLVETGGSISKVMVK